MATTQQLEGLASELGLTPFEQPADIGEMARNQGLSLIEPPQDTGQGRFSNAMNVLGRGFVNFITKGIQGVGQSMESISPVRTLEYAGFKPKAEGALGKILVHPGQIVSEFGKSAGETASKAFRTNPAYKDEIFATALPEALGQMAGLVGETVATRGSNLIPLIHMGMVGYASGYDEADRQGITDQAKRDALAASYGLSEALVERLGGVGSKAFAKRLFGEAAERGGESFIKRLVKTGGAEGLEEPFTGELQDIAANVFGGGEGEAPPSFDLSDPEVWKKRGKEFVVGALASSPIAVIDAAISSRPKPEEVEETPPAPLKDTPLGKPAALPEGQISFIDNLDSEGLTEGERILKDGKRYKVSKVEEIVRDGRKRIRVTAQLIDSKTTDRTPQPILGPEPPIPIEQRHNESVQEEIDSRIRNMSSDELAERIAMAEQNADDPTWRALGSIWKTESERRSKRKTTIRPQDDGLDKLALESGLQLTEQSKTETDQQKPETEKPKPPAVPVMEFDRTIYGSGSPAASNTEIPPADATSIEDADSSRQAENVGKSAIDQASLEQQARADRVKNSLPGLEDYVYRTPEGKWVHVMNQKPTDMPVGYDSAVRLEAQYKKANNLPLLPSEEIILREMAAPQASSQIPSETNLTQSSTHSAITTLPTTESSPAPAPAQTSSADVDSAAANLAQAKLDLEMATRGGASAGVLKHLKSLVTKAESATIKVQTPDGKTVSVPAVLPNGEPNLAPVSSAVAKQAEVQLTEPPPAKKKPKAPDVKPSPKTPATTSPSPAPAAVQESPPVSPGTGAQPTRSSEAAAPAKAEVTAQDTVSVVERAVKMVGKAELKKRANQLIQEQTPDLNYQDRDPEHSVESLAMEDAARLTVNGNWDSRIGKQEPFESEPLLTPVQEMAQAHGLDLKGKWWANPDNQKAVAKAVETKDTTSLPPRPKRVAQDMIDGKTPAKAAADVKAEEAAEIAAQKAEARRERRKEKREKDSAYVSEVKDEAEPDELTVGEMTEAEIKAEEEKGRRLRYSAAQGSRPANVTAQDVTEAVDRLSQNSPGQWVVDRVEFFETPVQAAAAFGVSPEDIGTNQGVYHPASGRSGVILSNVQLQEGETAADAIARVMVHESVGHGGLEGLKQIAPEVEKELIPIFKQVRESGWTYLDSDGNRRRLLDEYPDLDPEQGGTIEEMSEREQQLFGEWFARSVEGYTPQQLAKGQQPSLFQQFIDLIKKVVRSIFGGKEPVNADQFALDLAKLIMDARNVLPKPSQETGGSVVGSGTDRIHAGHGMMWSLPGVEKQGSVWMVGGKPISRSGEMDVAGLKSIAQLKDPEIEMYRSLVPEAFNGDKVNVAKLAEGLRENGPAIEVHTYGQDGKTNAAKDAYDKMTHEWYDNLTPDEKRKVNLYMSTPPDMADFDATGNSIDHLVGFPNTFKEKAKEYSKLSYAAQSEKFDGPRATSYYNHISPFDTKKHPVIRVDVTLPDKRDAKMAELRKELPQASPLRARAINNEVSNLLAAGSTTKWQQDDLHENLPNTLGWAMAQVVPDPRTSEPVLFVGELQSRWAQSQRDAESRYSTKQGEGGKWYVMHDDMRALYKPFESKKEADAARSEYLKNLGSRIGHGASPHPLLDLHQSLVLKAVIAEARKRGINKVAISDGETAMMTEMHDQTTQFRALDENGEPVPGYDYFTSRERADQYFKQHPDARVKSISQGRPSQEGGMRLAYDQTLPREAKRLTGGSGQMVDFGVHKNAQSSGVSGSRRYPTLEQAQEALDYRRDEEPDVRWEIIDHGNYFTVGAKPILFGSPVFKNEDGTPKSNVTARVYDLGKLTEAPFSKRNSELLASSPKLGSIVAPAKGKAKGFIQGIADLLSKKGDRTASGLLKDRSDLGLSKKWFHDYVGNAVDEAGRVHPVLGAAIEQVDFRQAQIAKDYDERMDQPWNKVFRKLSKEQDKELRLAYLSGDVAKQHEIVNEVAGAEGVKLYEKAIKDYEHFYEEAKKSGVKLGKVSRYLPTQLKTGAYPKLVNIMVENGLIDSHGRVLDKSIDEWAKMDEFEQAEAMQDGLRSMIGSRGGNFKGRTGVSLDPRVREKIADLYQPFKQTIPHYGIQLTEAMVRSEMLGPESIPSFKEFMEGSRPVDTVVSESSPMGVILSRLEKEGELNAHDLSRFKEVLNARMGYMPDKRLAQYLKGGNMLFALGNPFSAIKQPLTEIVKSLYANGLLPTIAGIGHAIRGTGVTVDDLHLNPDYELAHRDDPFKRINAALAKYSGFRKADLFPANVVGNAYLDALKRMPIEKRMKELEVLKDFFTGPDKDISLKEVAEKIGRGEFKDPDVWRVAWHGITNLRPTGLGTQPLFILRNNANLTRIAGNLKGWPIRQLNKLKEGVYDNLRSGDAEKVKDGLGQASLLLTGLVMAGVAGDAAVDWLLGKDVQFDEKVEDNLMKLVLGSRYQLNQLTGEQPSFKDAVLNYMNTPTMSFMSAAIDDMVKAAHDDEKGFMDIALKDKQLARAVPLGVGTAAYHWWSEGGEEDRSKKIEDRLSSNVQDLTNESSKLRELGEEGRKKRPSAQARWDRLSDFSTIKSFRKKLAEKAAAERDFDEAEAQLRALDRIAKNPVMWAQEAKRIAGIKKAQEKFGRSVD